MYFMSFMCRNNHEKQTLYGKKIKCLFETSVWLYSFDAFTCRTQLVVYGDESRVSLRQTVNGTFLPLYAAFPLIFIRHLQRNKDGPETVPEADSDFEEINAAQKQAVCCLEFILNLLNAHQML